MLTIYYFFDLTIYICYTLVKKGVFTIINFGALIAILITCFLLYLFVPNIKKLPFPSFIRAIVGFLVTSALLAYLYNAITHLIMT